MTFKLLTEHHLEHLSFKAGCTGSSKSSLIKILHCSKSYVMAQFMITFFRFLSKKEKKIKEKAKRKEEAENDSDSDYRLVHVCFMLMLNVPVNSF